MTCKPSAPLPPSWAYPLASIACILMAVVTMPLRHVLDLANIVVLFLLLVFLAALKLGRGPAVVSALLSVLLLDYFFVPPHLAFIPEDLQYLVTLLVMLAVALVTAQLTAGLQEQAAIACSRERQTQRLYRLARDLAGSESRWDVQRALDAFFASSGYRALLYLSHEEMPQPVAAQAPDGLIEETLRREEPTEAGDGSALLLPLCVPAHAIGVMVVTRATHDAPGPVRQKEMLLIVASLIAIGIERLRHVECAQERLVQAAAERLRGSILSALSHDLRTPLTALVGLADSLVLAPGAAHEQTRETAAAIRDQARAMSSLLANLLDMARLQTGKVALRKEWQFFDDVISSSVRLLRLSFFDHPVRVRLSPQAPLVEFDAVLMERVVWNLLENAVKYSAEGSAIEVSTFVEGESACLAVCDRGQGFAANRIDEVFEMFVRGNPESAKAGVGLGLAIARTIVEAHGGTIRAENRPGGGACVTVRLPMGTPPPIEEEEGNCEGNLS